MLLSLRYVLILFPVFSTMTVLPKESIGLFTLHTLLLLALVETRRAWLPERAQRFAAAAETVYVTWLSVRYQNMMFACHYSILLTYMLQEKSNLRWFLLALQTAMLNASLLGHADLELKLTANLLFATGALLLYLLADTGKSKAELEQVYDELRRKAYELDAARTRVLEYAGKVEQLVQAEERNRIAREIHDDLGHKLIRLKMMLEAAVRITPDQPEKGLDMTKQVCGQLAESMETLRLTVRRMKPDNDNVQSYSLSRLIEGLTAETGLDVKYEVNGIPRPLYPSLEIVLYRNAQEAVTNALRHGQATEVRIHMQYEPAFVRMTVWNNGAKPDVSVLRKGFGLSGMEERTQLVGGDLQWACDNYFSVTTIVPNSA